MNQLIFKKLLSIAFILTILQGCSEKRSVDPNKVYKLWAYEDPPQDIKIINGNYWESAHFTKEYIMFLELIAPEYWRKEFIKQNNLIIDTSQSGLPSDAPNCFKPTESYRKLTLPGFNQGSVYYEDTLSGHMFIYDIQL